MVCNANEAFVRNYLIQQNSEIKRKTQEKIQNISDEIKRKEEWLKNSPGNTSISQQIKDFIEQLSTLTIREVEITLNDGKQRNFDLWINQGKGCLINCR